MSNLRESLVRQKLILYLLVVLAVGTCGCRQVQSLAATNDNHPEPPMSVVQQSNERKPLELPLKDPRIVVHKSERKLELYSGKELLRTYKVGLGFSPIVDKVKEGDGATPEGDFYIFVKNSKSAYYLSLGVSYPNAEDADRGLRDKLISKAEHDAIISAIKKKVAPPQHTNLGGLIYIHGFGARKDWTWGCVALENEDIKELYDAVSVGAAVTILH